MAFTGAGLAIAWTVQWAQWVFAGIEPTIGEEAFTLIAALDLSLMVPFFLIGAVLLWRRRPWGYVLGAIMNLKGATYTLVLTAGSAVGTVRGIEGSVGQIPVWGAWTLMRPRGHRRAARGRAGERREALGGAGATDARPGESRILYATSPEERNGRS
jgi:hypothetical protein